MNLNLKGKNFLITGSSRGIGKAIAQIFLDEEANVGLVARSSNDLERTANSLKKSTGSKIFFWSSDLSDQSSVESLLDQVSEKWSTIDGLILNVGDGKSLHDPITSTDQWNNVWSTNFNTALFTARAFLEHLKTSSGCIVIISSICGLEALGAPTDYSVAKAALNAFSKI